jgi:hypothetical protein
MESARAAFYEEYKEKGNRIMLNFNNYSNVVEIIANG